MNRRAMRKTAVIFGIWLMFIFCGPQSVSAFRCGNDLVGEGDTKAKVLLTCGEPTYKEKGAKSTVKNAIGIHDPRGKKKNKVEKWYYNCGDNDFIYALQFENGILTKEDTEGRGKGTSDCLGKK